MALHLVAWSLWIGTLSNMESNDVVSMCITVMCVAVVVYVMIAMPWR